MIKFSERIISNVAIQMPITEEDIENIIVSAFEGGINYWAGIDNTMDDWKEKPADEPISTWAAKILLEGKGIIIYDIEKDIEELYECSGEDVADQGIWELTLEKLLKGISNYMSADYSNINKDTWDACSADCIIQYALFDRLVFG